MTDKQTKPKWPMEGVEFYTEVLQPASRTLLGISYNEMKKLLEGERYLANIFINCTIVIAIEIAVLRQQLEKGQFMKNNDDS